MEDVLYIDLFTPDEISRAKIALAKGDKLDKIVEEAMPRIDRMTGQENSARYMEYRLEYLASQHA